MGGDIGLGVLGTGRISSGGGSWGNGVIGVGVGGRLKSGLGRVGGVWAMTGKVGAAIIAMEQRFEIR